jgi:hypothetical protein
MRRHRIREFSGFLKAIERIPAGKVIDAMLDALATVWWSRHRVSNRDNPPTDQAEPQSKGEVVLSRRCLRN